MKETSVAERYAHALFLVLEDRRSVSPDAVRKDLARLSKTIITDVKLGSELRNPLVAVERKRALLRKNLGSPSEASAKVLFNFLNLLLAKKRLYLLPLILALFERDVEESRMTMKATVRSAAALSEDSRKGIEKQLSRVFGKKILVEASVHPELLAGVVVKAGDTVIDNSLRTRLKNMKAAMQS